MELNKIYNIDCLQGLRQLPDESVHCCVTSPPYWGLRDYGVVWQFGQEETPEAFVTRQVEVFREVRRVLRRDGTLWLNIGDSYASISRQRTEEQVTGGLITGKAHHIACKDQINKVTGSLKRKDLVGIPWMLAFALRADGWYLRQDIIWSKPNPMPEPTKDRCTKSHEYIFLLTKSQKYYFNQDAIRIDSGANRRSVWVMSGANYQGNHCATFPEELPHICILAGCPPDGVVLDPYSGAGTTALVARKLQRNFIGFELNPETIAEAEERLQRELGLFK
ncbi:site-specific DNA-methyltransferase (adenine-specific) [Chitinophaga eiseniae]|uniref:Methyltransferase n=1 Tax=Chitinophaga eiseniae TaxID=634771 RepID=A0A1T4SQF4_9BACT|nr:site-specific DNA-methyltransferase [Chitinophaga eiseniae]SKA30101.1 site-specific DNA-methyltransferase (adenine-specific) [Chitinophaga eiseniae]